MSDPDRLPPDPLGLDALLEGMVAELDLDKTLSDLAASIADLDALLADLDRDPGCGAPPTGEEGPRSLARPRPQTVEADRKTRRQ